MKDALKIEIATISIVHIIVIILSLVAFTMFYMRAVKDHAIKAFIVMQISIISWMVFKVFKTVSPTVTVRWGFIAAYYAMACIFEVAFLEFSYAYYKAKPIKKLWRILLYSIAITQFSIILTNPYHHLFYQTYDFWGDSFGILFYVHMVIEYSAIAFSFYYCYQKLKIQFVGKNMHYRFLILFAIIGPLIINLLYVTKIFHSVVRQINGFVIFDITPIVLTWSTMFFLYATFKHDFLNLSPLMKHEIVNKLDTPLCVLDSSFEIIYRNEKLIEDIQDDCKKIITHFIEQSGGIEDNYSGQVALDSVYYIINLKKISTLIETQYLVTFQNITSYKDIEQAIIHQQAARDSANKKLKEKINTLKKMSKMGARNFVAREMHDIIGHALVLAIKLLEVAKLYMKRDREHSMQALADAVSSLHVGSQNMYAIAHKNHLEKQQMGEHLKNILNKVLSRAEKTNVKTKMHFKGLYYTIDQKTFDVIYKVCIELITNTLKHANAKELFLSVTIRTDLIDILIIDNGKGAINFKKGHGLKGIEQRIAWLDGSVEFNTSGGEGFMSNIKLPRS